MEFFLIKLVAFVRIITSFEYAAVAFDIAGVGLFIILLGLLLANAALRKNVAFSAVDAAIAVFAVWCVAVSLIYFEESRVRDLAKLLIPLLSYTVVKNVVRSDADYTGLLFWIMAGFAIAIVGSLVLIALGQGVDYVTYWTGIPRWQGIYTGAHTFGHSMTLFVMIAVIYLHLKRRVAAAHGRGLPKVEGLLLLILISLALYCLYLSQVRTAMLGLAIFAVVCLYAVNKKALLLGGITFATLAVLSVPYWLPALFPDVVTLQQGRTDESNLGSGRLMYWQHNLELYGNLSIDKQLAGVGIGNRAETMYVGKNEVLDSHNDWLDILMQTGAVGFLIFAALQVLIFRAILSLPTPRRVGFLALFMAASAMMFVSDSYVWRVQVGHLYYIVLAYIEVHAPSPVAMRGEIPISGASPPAIARMPRHGVGPLRPHGRG